MKSMLFAVAGLTVLIWLSIFLPISSDSPTKALQESLSLKQALGQTLLVGFDGKEMTPKLKTFMRRIQPGGVLLLGRNIENPEQVKKLIRDLQEMSKIPLFVAIDQEGGLISRIPRAESAAQSGLKDFNHAFEIGEQRAKDLKDVGINMNLAPVLDSLGVQDYLFPRSFQKDERAAAHIAAGLMRGHEAGGVFTVPKHFPGYGGIDFNPENTTIPKVLQIPDIGLFEKVAKEISFSFLMVSHVVYEDFDAEAPFPFSSLAIPFVQEKFGKNVIVMSDDLLSKAFVSAYELSEIGVKAVESEIDILLVAGYPRAEIIEEFYDVFLEAVKNDKTLQSRIQHSAEKILKLKREILEFDPVRN